AVAEKRRVGGGDLAQPQRRRLDDEVVERDLAGVAEDAVERGAERDQGRGVARRGEIEVGDLLLRIGEPARDGLPHRREGVVEELLAGWDGEGERQRCGRGRSGRLPGGLGLGGGSGGGGGRGAAVHRGADVALDDAAAGTGSADGAEVDAVLGGES